MVNQLYDYTLPFFKESGDEQYQLEVIHENTRVITAYDRIGFKIKRELKCFRAPIHPTAGKTILLESAFNTVRKDHTYYS